MVILLLMVVASSLFVIASYPPLDLGILAWIGLSPLLFALRQRGLFVAACIGFLFGGLFGLGSFSWSLNIATFNIFNFIISLVIFSFYFLAFGIFYKLISRRIGSWIIVGGPALWVAIEYMRSNLFFLSMPWNLLGHSQHRYLLIIQIVNMTGVYGISFLIVMVNQFLSEVLDLLVMKRSDLLNDINGGPRGLKLGAQFLVGAFSLGLTLFYGWHSLATSNTDKALRVALVQANLLARNNMSVKEQVEYLNIYRQLTKDAAQGKPDLIIWPASSLPAPISSRLVRFVTVRLAHETGVYLLVGGSGHEKDKERQEGDLPYSNSEFLISPSGHLERQYNKIRLLAFNEYLPLQGIIKWPKWITTIRGSFIRGEEYTLFQVSGAKFGAPICWENMFPDFFRRFVKEGANFMVSVTNEGFFGDRSAPYYQSLAINVFRAVENRVAIVRSATTGISCIILPNGEIIERIRDGNGKDLGVSGFLVRDIPLSNKKTFYTRYGDVFAFGVIGIALVTVLLSLFKGRERSSN
jgi:apolipoprotein N-acyltransferase